MTDKEQFENILLGGLLKCYQDAVDISEGREYLISSNFSILAAIQLKKYDIETTFIRHFNKDEYTIRYSLPKDRSVLYDLSFDTKAELRNSKIKEIINY